MQTLARGWLAHPDARMGQLIGVATDLAATITPQDACERVTAPAAAQALAAMLRTWMLQHWPLLAGCQTIVDRSLVRDVRVVQVWAERLARALPPRRRLIHILTVPAATIQRAGRQTWRQNIPNL